MKIRRCSPKVLAVLAGLSVPLSLNAPVARGGDVSRRSTPMTDALAQRLKHLTLDDAIDIALHRNPQILNQLQEIQRLQGVFVQVRAAALPHVIATGTFSAEDQISVGRHGGQQRWHDHRHHRTRGRRTDGRDGHDGHHGHNGHNGGHRHHRCCRHLPQQPGPDHGEHHHRRAWSLDPAERTHQHRNREQQVLHDLRGGPADQSTTRPSRPPSGRRASCATPPTTRCARRWTPPSTTSRRSSTPCWWTRRSSTFKTRACGCSRPS